MASSRTRASGTLKAPRTTGQKLVIAAFILVVAGIIAYPLYQSYQKYQQYSARSAVGEGLAAASDLRVQVVESYLVNETMPVSNTEAGAAPPESFGDQTTERITISSMPTPGTVVISYRPGALPGLDGARDIRLLPTVDGRVGINWTCDATDLPAWARPVGCR